MTTSIGGGLSIENLGASSSIAPARRLTYVKIPAVVL